MRELLERCFAKDPRARLRDIGEARVLLANPGAARNAPGSLSPDGRWLAYSSNETGDVEVYLRPFPGPGALVRVSTSGGSRPFWSRDGRELFFTKERKTFSVRIASSAPLEVGPPALLFESTARTLTHAQRLGIVMRMLDRHDALQLLDYDRWANTRIGERLRALATPLPAAERLFAHIVGASELWWERVRGGDTAKLPVWPEGRPIAEALARFATVADAWRAHVERADAKELARRVEFTNSAGQACADRLDDILRHLANHGTHHRGQIASQLRAAGHAPETLDFIVWRRSLATVPAPVAPKWKHFVIESTYLAGLEQIDAKLAAHRAHLETGFRAGMLLASGPQEPRTGGMILARARERREIEEFLARDPFALAGISRYRVIEFEPVKQAPLFAGWAGQE